MAAAGIADVVNAWMLLGAALLLSVERLCYIFVWRAPDLFRAWCRGAALVPTLARRLARSDEPVEVLAVLFVVFKALQVGVFVAWCYVHGDGSLRPASLRPASLQPGAADAWVFAAGAVLVLVGQFLSASVFSRLGKTGVFYGNKLGRDIPWCRGFPFNWFAHPQYVGTVLSIWGFFLFMRYPAPDWIVLPVLETIYYVAGARWEQDRGARKGRAPQSEGHPSRMPGRNAAAQNGRGTR